MGTDTKALFSNAKREQIIKILKMWNPQLKIRPSEYSDSVYFDYKGENRILHLSDFAWSSRANDGIPQTPKELIQVLELMEELLK